MSAKRGPYTIWKWWLSIPLLGVALSVGTWVAALNANDVMDMEFVSLVVLGLSTGAFCVGGVLAFVFAILARKRMFEKIIYQDDMLAILIDEGGRDDGEMLDFAVGLVKGRIHAVILAYIISHLRTQGIRRRFLWGDIPFTMLYVQKEPVVWRWMGLERLVHGVQNGSVCRIEMQPTWESTVRLANHEIAHVVIEFGLKRWEGDHHVLMDDSEVSKGEYLDGLIDSLPINVE